MTEEMKKKITTQYPTLNKVTLDKDTCLHHILDLCNKIKEKYKFNYAISVDKDELNIFLFDRVGIYEYDNMAETPITIETSYLQGNPHLHINDRNKYDEWYIDMPLMDMLKSVMKECENYCKGEGKYV